MASLDARLESLLTEQKNLRAWIGDESKVRREDHDRLTKLEKDVEALQKEIDEIKQWQKDRDKEAKDGVKEGSGRRWSIWLELVGALLAALAGAAISKLWK